MTIGGLDQPVISQRKNDADIRVRDGEVSLLGGLMQTQDTNTINGIPGLVNIPILGQIPVRQQLQGQVTQRAADRADSAHRAEAGYRRAGSARHRGGTRIRL